MKIAGVEVDNNKILESINNQLYRKVFKYSTTPQHCCSICNQKIYDWNHIKTCRDNKTEVFVSLLKKHVVNFHYERLKFVSMLDFTGLKIHPLDMVAIKILKKLFVLFTLSVNVSVLYDIFLVLNCYNVQSHKSVVLEKLFDKETLMIVKKSLSVHVNILILLKERSSTNPIPYRLALYEITELYHVNEQL